MLSIDPNYRSLPEQVDFLTDKQEEQEIINSNQAQINTEQQNDITNLGLRQTTSENKITNLEVEVAQHTEDISNLNSDIEAVSGKGGYLIPHNFGTATPTEQQLNAYALSQITNITQPVEIFNGTRVTNLYNNHTWILNNTQDTDPIVFEWVDLGQSLVSIATNSTEGVVKGSADNLKVAVAVDGTMSVNGLNTELESKQDTLNTTNIPSGTIIESIGFNSNNELVKGSAGGGSLYAHIFTLPMHPNSGNPVYAQFTIIKDNAIAFTNGYDTGSDNTLRDWLLANGFTADSTMFVRNGLAGSIIYDYLINQKIIPTGIMLFVNTTNNHLYIQREEIQISFDTSTNNIELNHTRSNDDMFSNKAPLMNYHIIKLS